MVNRLARGAVGGGTDQGVATVYQKTQVHAKTQVAVYALTPARCRKVKRIRHAFAEAVNSSPGKRRW